MSFFRKEKRYTSATKFVYSLCDINKLHYTELISRLDISSFERYMYRKLREHIRNNMIISWRQLGSNNGYWGGGGREDVIDRLNLCLLTLAIFFPSIDV